MMMCRTQSRRAFSLIEVLIAIFILGIGVLGIAALFPAGIAQQRRAVDDAIGPVVAENAMAVIRSKVRPEFFGAAEDFDPGFSPLPRRTIVGDWMWRRPVYFTEDASLSIDHCGSGTTFDVFVPAGSISLFSTYAQTTNFDELRLPWNPEFFPCNPDVAGPPPDIFITQQERFYPQMPGGGRPQYVWDCMFRKQEGKILVAIFVYRVTAPSGGGVPFRVDGFMPIRRRMDSDTAWNAGAGGRVIDAANNEVFVPIPLAGAGAGIDPFNVDDQWQLPGQMLLDQNNQVHRVISGRTVATDGALELARPVAPVLGNPFDPFPGSGNTESPNYYFGPVGGQNPITDEFQAGMVQEDVVTDIWYLPDFMDIDVDDDGTPEATYSITPVYVTVREL